MLAQGSSTFVPKLGVWNSHHISGNSDTWGNNGNTGTLIWSLIRQDTQRIEGQNIIRIQPKPPTAVAVAIVAMAIVRVAVALLSRPVPLALV